MYHSVLWLFGIGSVNLVSGCWVSSETTLTEKCTKGTTDNAHCKSWEERKYRGPALHRIAFSRNRVKDAATREASMYTLRAMTGRLAEEDSSGMQAAYAIGECDIGSIGTVPDVFLVAVASGFPRLSGDAEYVVVERISILG